MKITKSVITGMKDEIYSFCKAAGIPASEFTVFYNGKMSSNISKNWRKTKIGVTNNVNPLDYCEYYPEHFILGLAFDGAMYDLINGHMGEKAYQMFTSIFVRNGLYLEMCDTCHAAICNIQNKEEEIEYTIFKKKEIKYIYNSENAPDSNIKTIMDAWYEMSKKEGDIGSCVIGAYMEFEYKGTTYRMSPQSPYQGSLSWESGVETVEKMLKEVGAENIHFNYGMLD